MLWHDGVVFALSLLVMLLLHTSEAVPWLIFAAINGYGLLSAAQALLLLEASSANEDALFLPMEAVRVGARLHRVKAAE